MNKHTLNSKAIFKLIYKLWLHIEKKRKLQLYLLFFFMLLVSVVEVVSVGSIIPFLAILSSPNHVFDHQIIQSLSKFFLIDVKLKNNLLFFVSILFIFIILISGFLRLILLWLNTRISFSAGADISFKVYKKTLHQPFLSHVNTNSSDVISNVSGKSNAVIYGVLMPILTISSSLVMLAGIIFFLVFINPLIALTTFMGFASLYYAILMVTRNKLQKDGEKINKQSTLIIKCLQEGLGGIRDVLIDGTQNFYSQIYKSADYPLRRSQGNILFLSLSPRYIVESLGMVFIVILAIYVSIKNNGIQDSLPILGVMAFGAQRMLPLLQQIYAAWSNILSSGSSLKDILKALELPNFQYQNTFKCKRMNFSKSIVLKDISFKYDQKNNTYILEDINLAIKKGSKVGIIGKTGSGKSTLLDLIMGLLEPTNGKLEIDNKKLTKRMIPSWQKNISHVPQFVYLSDSSILENIAFGLGPGEIDFLRVVDAAKQAQIHDDIQSWPNKYDTFVGERGVRLSGGQRQRIGIARALYKKSQVIIFDESTNALDLKTEKLVMNSINSLDDKLTLIIVTHRLSSLKNCSMIYSVNNKKVFLL